MATPFRPPSLRRNLGRVGLLLAAGWGLASGCRTQPTTTTTTPTPPRTPKPAVTTPHMEALDASVGRVAAVQTSLRFVVLDYSLSRVPQPGDRLELSRGGTVVGELKTGFHSRANTVVADIVNGTPEVGDEARPLRPQP